MSVALVLEQRLFFTVGAVLDMFFSHHIFLVKDLLK